MSDERTSARGKVIGRLPVFAFSMRCHATDMKEDIQFNIMFSENCYFLSFILKIKLLFGVCACNMAECI